MMSASNCAGGQSPHSADLNHACFCVTLDTQALHAALSAQTGGEQLWRQLLEARPNLFSSVTSFAPGELIERMKALVEAVERVAKMPAYEQAALEHAPTIARVDHGPAGVFMGYDFHLGPDGPQLIEINTNAGGAFLNAALAEAQRTCCAATDARSARISPPDGFPEAVRGMFESEWQRQRGSAILRRIAVADDRPTEQYLYPEFLIARELLGRLGWETDIVDAAALRYSGGQLLANGRPIDLVYNRVTDFALASREHEALRDAYVAGDVVLTPNPRNHALLADKRNLILLSDLEWLANRGADSVTINTLLAGIPRTIAVTPERAEELWAERRKLFFKPAAGFGSKAAYRGEKITRAVWSEILSGEFIAQTFAPPSERNVRVDGEITPRKMDVRLYTYRSQVLLAAARLYQGQTTNFRTPGGGFAPVLLTAGER